MKKTVATLYIVGIHVLLVFVLMKSNFIEKVEVKFGMKEPALTGHSYYMDALGRYFVNRSETMKKGDGLVFIGDSITDGLSVETIFDGVNFGISGDTVASAKERVANYKNLEEKTIVLAIGVNDIPRKTEKIASDYELVIQRLPKNSFVIISSILPLEENSFDEHYETKKNNEQIVQLNSSLAQLASRYPNTVYIDSSSHLKDASGNLNGTFHNGDGLHLNVSGYMMWAAGLKEEFKKLVERGSGGSALRRASL